MKMRTPASAAAFAAFTASPLSSSPSVKMISARLPIALLPKVCTARSIASEMLVPPSGIVLGVEIVDRLDRGVVINRQRSLQKGATRKRDQPDTVALQFVDKILRGQLHALETVRRHIVRQHAARGVDRQDQVESLCALRLRRCNPSAVGRERSSPDASPRRTSANRILRRRRSTVRARLWQQSLRNKFAQPQRRRVVPRAPKATTSSGTSRAQNQYVAPKIIVSARAKFLHGNFFQMVCDNRICATSRPHPAMMQAGKRSRYC